MLSINNILSPADGSAVASPTQDMVLGCFYLTKEREADGEAKRRVFGDIDEVLVAYQHRALKLHDYIRLPLRDGKIIDTTVGRVVFNEIVPEELDFINEALDKRRLELLVGECHRRLGPYRTALFLPPLKLIESTG